MPTLGRLIARWNRTARKAGLTGDLSISEWLTTLEHFQRRCAYCGGAYWNMDHFIPQSLQGLTGIENCLPSCLSCNQRKAGSHPDTCIWIAPDACARIHAYLDPLVIQQATWRHQQAEKERSRQIAAPMREHLVQTCLTQSQREAGSRRDWYQEMAKIVGSDVWLPLGFSVQHIQDLLDAVQLKVEQQEELAVSQEVEAAFHRLCTEAPFPVPKHADPATSSTHFFFVWSDILKS